jgi:hypothetical protein
MVWDQRLYECVCGLLVHQLYDGYCLTCLRKQAQIGRAVEGMPEDATLHHMPRWVLGMDVWRYVDKAEPHGLCGGTPAEALGIKEEG